MRPDGSGAAAGGRTGRRPPGTERRGRAMAGPAMVATLCRSAARRPGVRGAGQPSVAGRRAGPAGASQRRRRRRARAPLLPRVDANYTLTREHLPKNYIYPPPTGGSVVSDNRLALDFSYELDFWGKNRARLQAAVSQRDAADADAQAARNLLARAIVRSYLNLQNAFAQREVLQRVLSQRAEVVDLTRGRKAAGLDTEVEVKQAESSLAAGRVEVKAAGLDTEVEVKQAESSLAAGRVELTRNETTIAQLRNQVAALAGAGPVRGQALAPVALTAPGGVIDVTAARWRAIAARHGIEAAKAEFYPNINLVAFAGFEALGTGRLLDAGSRAAGIGPAITLPIFHGGELNANLAGRRADADLAVSDYNQTVLDAVQQTADAIDALRLLGREQAEQRQAREAIDAAYDLAVRRYRAGLGWATICRC
ncbi:outer membrane efflux protein [Bordetella pertussis CHLA-15]|nr:outer membrane efflux protein [Bordetella pertussis CHLA-15]